MSLENFVPNVYKKNVLDINYKKLKSKGIKCIMFDLDNTLAIVDCNLVSKEITELLKKLQKDFKIIIVSNNFKKRIKYICDIIKVDFISFSMKPLSIGFKKVKKKYKYSNEEICMIGDQLMSDILGGNCFGIMTILVEPLSNKDLKITKFNRILEKNIFKKLENKNILKRGIYYE